MGKCTLVIASRLDNPNDLIVKSIFFLTLVNPDSTALCDSDENLTRYAMNNEISDPLR